MSEKYQGSCHCGAVKYETTADLSKVIACNCSMCNRSGTILTFVPESDFKLISGAENLTDYQFNKKTIHHLFCKACGVKSFARAVGPDGSLTYAVNVRCLDGVDVSTLKPEMVNGKDF